MTVSEVDEATGPHSVLERIAGVVEVLSWADGLTLAELSRRCDIPRSSLHRILQQLVDIGWVERLDRQYRLGTVVRELGRRNIRQTPIHRSAIPWMYRVRDATRLNVHLSILSGFESVSLETIWGRRAPTQCNGARQPAHGTASGKVLLAGLLAGDPELVAMPELRSLTRFTTTSKAVLLREVHKVRDEGMAIAREECLMRWVSVAVPVGPITEATHALSVSGPVRAVQSQEVTRYLRSAATRCWLDATRVVPRRRAHRIG